MPELREEAGGCNPGKEDEDALTERVVVQLLSEGLREGEKGYDLAPFTEIVNMKKKERSGSQRSRADIGTC